VLSRFVYTCFRTSRRLHFTEPIRPLSIHSRTEDLSRCCSEGKLRNSKRWESIIRTPLVRWTIRVFLITRAPRNIVTSWVDNPRPLGCPQMNWGRTLGQALRSNDLPSEFSKWREIAADRNQWPAICGSKRPSATRQTTASFRQGTWAELRNGTVHS
jgi:hypothetical protein